METFGKRQVKNQMYFTALMLLVTPLSLLLMGLDSIFVFFSAYPFFFVGWVKTLDWIIKRFSD